MNACTDIPVNDASATSAEPDKPTEAAAWRHCLVVQMVAEAL